MKKLLICLAALAFIAGFGVMEAEAAPTDTIAVTVTLQNISVSVTPEAWTIGYVAAGSTIVSGFYTATNDGNVNENLDIAVAGSAAWAVGATPGVNVFAMDREVAGAWLNITTGGVTLIDNLGFGLGQTFNLRFKAPSEGSNTNLQTIIVTVTAEAAAP